jgi:hypothetical protein
LSSRNAVSNPTVIVSALSCIVESFICCFPNKCDLSLTLHSPVISLLLPL